MIKNIVLLGFVSFSPFVLGAKSLTVQGSYPVKELQKLAQDDSLFDDSDLADIEGSETLDDSNLTDNQNNPEEENFDVGDFETFDEGLNEEASPPEDKPEDFNQQDYEAISDRPGYEVTTDQDLEKEFEGESTNQDDDYEDEDYEDEEENQEGDEDDGSDEDGEDEDQDFESENSNKEQDEQTDDTGLENLEGEPEDFIDIESENQEDESFPQDEGFSEDQSSDLPQEDSQLDESSEDSNQDFLNTEEDLNSDNLDPEDQGAFNLVTNIRYLSEKDQIVIDCSEFTSYQERYNQKTEQFIIEIVQSQLAENIDWPYVLRDFNSRFGLIKADQKDSSTVRVLIQLKQGSGQPKTTLSKTGDQILIGYGELDKDSLIPEGGDSSTFLDSGPILPAKTLEDLYSEDLKFTGNPISFHIIDAPIKQVLRFISEESGLNMVIGESVSGNITLKLEDVPWDQALHTIFKVKSLGYTRDGNVITILPLTEIESRAKKLKEISEQQKSLIPFETKVIPISYGQVSDIVGKVKDFSTPANNVSKGGKIISHEESNTFIVIDTPQAIKKIEGLARFLDKPPKQVMIEAKIVDASENFARNFGLTWGISGNVPVSIDFSGFLELFQNVSGNYFVNPASQNPASVNLNGLPIIGNITASLSLAEGDGYAKVISSPKVVVISGKQASITRDTPVLIPITTTQTQTPGGDTSTSSASERESVSISLDVTPTVTTMGSVFLEVNVTRSDPGGRAGAFKTSRTAQTNVLAKNGQTIVIGGIYEQDEALDSNGLPFLRKIPFLNLLFNTKGINRSKSELLVFITPKLLDSHE